MAMTSTTENSRQYLRAGHRWEDDSRAVPDSAALVSLLSAGSRDGT